MISVCALKDKFLKTSITANVLLITFVKKSNDFFSLTTRMRARNLADIPLVITTLLEIDTENFKIFIFPLKKKLISD